jgi:hypothetical protein
MHSIVKLSGLVLLFVALPAAAHHSRAIYDRDQVVTIEGIVTGFEWANPHVYLYVRSDGPDGERNWAFEGGVTTVLRRQGWSRDSFAPGDRVAVSINPARTTRHQDMGLLYAVEKDDVTLYSLSARVVPPPDTREFSPVEADSIEGLWQISGNPSIKLFSEPYSWRVTPKAEQAQAVYDDLTMNPQIQCNARTSPWVMIFTGVHLIELGDETVSIRTEYDTVERTIHMNVASHDGAAVTHQGHSIGRWDGDALVVDTTHFADHRSGNARGIPSGSQKHLVERFELNQDRLTMTYSYVLEDPEHLSEPVNGALQSTHRTDVEFVPIPCDPDNAGRYAGESARRAP